MRSIEIVGSGIALPKRVVKSSEIDKQLGYKSGQIEAISGVFSRYYATTESATDLAIAAVFEAFSNTSVTLQDVECIIAASGTMEQAIPCNAAKIHARLNLSNPIPAFDINMTCLSALMALDLAASMIMSGQYKVILIVSSDIASVGIDLKDRETVGLFGDGAAALVVTESSVPDKGILVSHFATYSEGINYCQIQGGGSLNHPSKVNTDYKKYGIFEMQGKEIFRLTAKVIDDFIIKLFSGLPYSLNDIDWVVPHQASALAISHLQKRLKIPTDKIINILNSRGNQIAASLPSALHELIISGKASAGDKVLLIGTSAGLSIGGMILVL
ncbi:MAG: hypothetical protein OQK98_04520 [Gammaproteobacteria bacterium]|nr:hypothetical protein [Gammaproteobacteria bacterium]